eukprot:scaffold92123_cov16-Prasinocladus_malaysianus.AAC.2
MSNLIKQRKGSEVIEYEYQRARYEYELSELLHCTSTRTSSATPDSSREGYEYNGTTCDNIATKCTTHRAPKISTPSDYEYGVASRTRTSGSGETHPRALRLIPAKTDTSCKAFLQAASRDSRMDAKSWDTTCDIHTYVPDIHTSQAAAGC